MEIKFRILGAFALLTILASVDASSFLGCNGPKEPKSTVPLYPNDLGIEQPLDHFNMFDKRTWRMRFYEEIRYFNGSGPILIELGGRGTFSDTGLLYGLMHDIGSKIGALMFSTEHRFYGYSRPTEDLTVKNMRYLSIDQTLADIANFIKVKKAERNIENAKVIVFGCGYAGNLAAWARLKYPHLIQGAVASGAPVQGKADFSEYYEEVTKILERYNPDCAAEVKIAFNHTEALFSAENGSTIIQAIYNFCEPLENTRTNASFFMNYLASYVFGKTVKDNSGFDKICATMTNRTYSSPVERLANTITHKEYGCRDYRYKDHLAEANFTAWLLGTYHDRHLLWQACTGYGHFQTANSTKSFGSLFDLDYFVNECTIIFGKDFNKDLVESRVRKLNLEYGGKNIDVTNVVFINGDADPWHRLSVLEDINESSPAILIPGGLHCEDLNGFEENAAPELKEARERIRKLVYKWAQIKF